MGKKGRGGVGKTPPPLTINSSSDDEDLPGLIGNENNNSNSISDHDAMTAQKLRLTREKEARHKAQDQSAEDRALFEKHLAGCPSSKLGSLMVLVKAFKNEPRRIKEKFDEWNEMERELRAKTKAEMKKAEKEKEKLGDDDDDGPPPLEDNDSSSDSDSDDGGAARKAKGAARKANKGTGFEKGFLDKEKDKQKDKEKEKEKGKTSAAKAASYKAAVAATHAKIAAATNGNGPYPFQSPRPLVTRRTFPSNHGPDPFLTNAYNKTTFSAWHGSLGH